VPGDDGPGAAVLLESAHGTQPRLEAAVVGLDTVVGVLIGAMPGRWQQRFQHRRVRRRLVSDDLDRRALGRADGPLEEAAGSSGVIVLVDLTWP
jgi:hypothetical protein